mmetsp:Transcript_943/g.1451  ORF Transcript_943/g.1451 Transcript_943/m.1451 type:complete len:122 (-) Transcript_943:1554-1919(-)
MAAQLSVRFRSTHGDVGPFSFSEEALVSALKERLLQEWPKDGPLAKEPPTDASSLKLILSGKFVESNKPLKEYKKDMGEIKADTVVTMHVVVRQSTAPVKQSSSAPADKPEAAKSGCCIVS